VPHNTATASAAASTAPDELPAIGHWIDATATVPDRSRTAPVFDPANRVVAARVALAGDETIGAAVRSASVAFSSWSDTPVAGRVRIMYRLRESEIVELACSAAVMPKGEYSEQVAGRIDTYSMRQPLGVRVGITP
jgi:malonate-semialdehyde dehydrogenase (acetylating)/methylmalonate-semialdehyde dehydrogenase